MQIVEAVNIDNDDDVLVTFIAIAVIIYVGVLIAFFGCRASLIVGIGLAALGTLTLSKAMSLCCKRGGKGLSALAGVEDVTVLGTGSLGALACVVVLVRWIGIILVIGNFICVGGITRGIVACVTGCLIGVNVADNVANGVYHVTSGKAKSNNHK